MNPLDQDAQSMDFIVKDDVSQLNEKLRLPDTPTGNESTSASVNKQQSTEELPSSRLPTVVGFRSIQIREFDRIVGDHPDVKNGGPPLSIGWDYMELEEMDLDDYEQRKQEEKDEAQKIRDNNGGWPTLPGLRRLPSGKRRDLLRINFDVPLEDILAAEAEVERTRKQREQTNRQKAVFARGEEMMQSASRKLKRTFSRDWPDYQAFPKRRDVASVVPRFLQVAPLPPTNKPVFSERPPRMREISV